MARKAPSADTDFTDIEYFDVEWEKASCTSATTKLFFPTYATSGHPVASRVTVKHRTVPSNVAAICNSCEIRKECRQWGIHHELYGIWGGLSDYEREEIRRRLGIKRSMSRIVPRPVMS